MNYGVDCGIIAVNRKVRVRHVIPKVLIRAMLGM
jgi:hypothetical protein